MEPNELTVTCPYCAQPFEVLVEPDDIGGELVEDCRVCCRPISFSVRSDENGDPVLEPRREDD
ncbi:MAG: CPXCG motif-containing cysteine-rich protein [Chitinivibrionales bacterium]|nr:CPXCG motif-containing cysteine-rich protein [Chitinivibrionales bacterium]